MRVVLLRPPRYVWPFNSETSAFWQPLGLLCLAGAVRRELPQVEIHVWDAPGEKIGWRTLHQRLAERKIDVLGVGEETVSAHEALRAAEMVKQLYPDCLVVAGGTYFPYAIEDTLQSGYVDVIVRGEGELTFVELLHHIADPDQWRHIDGLAYRDENQQTVITRPRSLIDNLDDLPLPAYDLVKMNLYGRNSRNHPALTSIEHSRGCIDSCSFCILWKHMGQSVNGNGRLRPCWRTKSPQRSFAEVRRLYRHYGRRTFGWVDPTFNVSSSWSDAWAELMLKSELLTPRGPQTIHTAWFRADGIVRDEKHGVLEKLVRAGLRQVMIGIERIDPDSLAILNKHHNSWEICRQACFILRQKYPQVYTIGTVIFGLPGDTKEDLHRLIDAQYQLGLDYCFIMPLTPNPGTESAHLAAQKGYIINENLNTYNFHTPVCRTAALNLHQLESTYWRLMLNPSPRRISHALGKLFCARDPRKRRVHWALWRKGASIAFKSLTRALLPSKNHQPTLYSRRPSWYDK